MPIYSTPGVYFEWMDTRSDNVVASRTDIAGFVGITERGVLQQPTRVESWNQFTTIFGGYVPRGFLAYAVQGFFNNGGRRCWIVRVGDKDTASAAKVILADVKGKESLTVAARSPGVWGRQISVSVVSIGTNRFNLKVRLPDGTQEFWPNLSLDSGEPRFLLKLLNDSRTGSRLVEVQIGNDRTPGTSLTNGTFNLLGGSDGIADIPKDGLSPAQKLVQEMTQALATLELIDEVAIVAMPDGVIAPRFSPSFKVQPHDCSVLEQEVFAAPSAVPASISVPVLDTSDVLNLQRALIQHCEMLRDRVAIVDAPESNLNPEQILRWRQQFRSEFAALYYPWIKVPDPLGLEGLLRAIPPSAHVAGIYAQVEQRVGPHKPPANELLENVEDVSVAVDDGDHGWLNMQGINVIRPFQGRRIRIAGARTLTDPSDTQRQFVNVRRLLLMIERSIQQSTQWLVFEPNSPNLWLDIDRVIRSFLDGLWKKGFLDGATADQAYSVKCDSTTNPPAEIDNGRVICEIGLLPPWPAEFVIVRIGITPGGAEILNAMEAQSA